MIFIELAIAVASLAAAFCEAFVICSNIWKYIHKNTSPSEDDDSKEDIAFTTKDVGKNIENEESSVETLGNELLVVEI